MSTITNETVQKSSFQGPAAENEGSESQGVGIQAPTFSITSGEEGTNSDEELADKYLEDLGGAEAIDDAFRNGFAQEFAAAAGEFESSWAELDAYDLKQSDRALAAGDHQYGAVIMDALIGSISAVVDAPEDMTEESLEAKRETTYKNLDLLTVCTDLQLSYIKLFKAIKSKDLQAMMEVFIKIYDSYNYVDLLVKLKKLHADTEKLQKMMEDANKMLLKEGSDMMVDVVAIGLEASILAALGISNPIIGGVIMLGLIYGTKSAKDSIIQVPESPDDPLCTFLLTRTDESLDLLSKNMDASKSASDGFKNATGKIGKVKNGLTVVTGAAKTYQAYGKIKELEEFFDEYKKNAETLSNLYISDYAEKIEASGKAAKALYEAGLEIGPTIDEALVDIQFYRTELQEIELGE